MATKGLISLALAGVLATGCTSAAPPERSRPTLPETEVTQIDATSGCRGETEIISDESNRLPGELEGDVDGDGSPDQVSIFAAKGERGCEAFLTVRTSNSIASTPVAEDGFSIRETLPALVGLAQVDGRPGKEVIVRLVTGASTEFMGLFSMGQGDLRRLTGGLNGLFPSGGSVGHLEQSDCGAPGTVIISVAVPQGRRYLLRRAVYVFDGTGFVEKRHSSTRELVDADELASGEVPGFAAGAPFASCPTD